MSAIAAAHYAPAAASVPDGRYAAHYDPATFFSYSPPSLGAVSATSLDGQYGAGSSGAPYLWDAHEPAVQSAPAYSSSASANAYHSAAAPASTGHSSVTASFAYTAQPDYAAVSSHRAFPSNPSRAAPAHHHAAPAPSSSSSSAAAAAHASSSGRGRQSYTSGTRSYSSLAAAATTHASSSHSPTPRLQNASWDSAGLYTIDQADPAPHSSPQHAYSRVPTSTVPAASATPPIKEEDPEGEFIIEVSVPADPVPSSMPEVPLRATHAPPKMRSMMCSFRLESFAMHDGIRSAATQPGPGGIVVGPLRERPVEFEWQADLVEPLIPQEEDAFRYGAGSSGSKSLGYNMTRSPPSPRKATVPQTMSPRRTRADYATAGTASPALSLDYPSVDNDTWDVSSGYGSVADNGSGSGTAATASPTFAPIMTPAQSLGWSLRYQPGEADLESPGGYHRQAQAVTQTSLSRVSQSTGRYLLGGSSSASMAAKAPYHHQPQPQAQYGYDSGGYSSRSSGGGRAASGYSEVYASASSGSASGWYR